MKKLRIGIDNYGLHPLHLSPLDIMKWAETNGAEGVHFSGLSPEEEKFVDNAYLKDLAQYASSKNLYIEWGGGQHIPFDMDTWEKKDVFEINRKVCAEAVVLGTRIVRSCSGGLMRWNPESPTTDALLKETADCLRSQRRMIKDFDVILAIETHFEFTTHELVRLFELCEAEPGDYLGICLDTMNVLTMLENPVMAVERIFPWVVSCHIKDGAIRLCSEGLVIFPVEIGSGIVDFQVIAERLAQLPRDIHLSVEDHGGSFLLPVFDHDFLAKFPDLTLEEFTRLFQLVQQAEDDIKAGQLAVVEREKWPEICELRMKRDIQALKKKLNQ